MFCEFIDMYSNSIVSSLFMTATTKLQSLNVKWIVQQWYIPLNWLAKIEFLPMVYSAECKQGVICAKNKTCWCMMSHCLVLMVWLWLLKLDSLLDCCPSNVLLFQHSQVHAWKFLWLFQSFNESSMYYIIVGVGLILVVKVIYWSKIMIHRGCRLYFIGLPSYPPWISFPAKTE